MWNKPPESLSDLDVITSSASLHAHDPMAPAVLIVPPTMVAGVWYVIEHRTERSDFGELCRQLETALTGLGEAARNEPGAELLPQGLSKALVVVIRLLTTQRPIQPETTLIVDAGEADDNHGNT